MERSLKFIAIGTSAFISSFSFSNALAQEQNVFEYQFTSLKSLNQDACCSHSQKIVDSPAREGNTSARFELRASDPESEGGLRSEVNFGRDLLPNQSERWVAFSTYLPTDYGSPTDKATFMQMRPKTGGPAVGLYAEDGRFVIRTRTGSGRSVNNNESDNKYFDGGKVSFNQWIDWVYHVKLFNDDRGLVKVWKNGVKVMESTQPIGFDENDGLSLKLGVYSNRLRDSNSEKRVVYVDSLKVGNADANYQDVAPDNSSRPDPSPTPKPEPKPEPGVSKISENFSSSSASTRFIEVSGRWSIENGKYVLSDPLTEVVPAMGNISVHKMPVKGNFILTAEASVAATSSSYDDFSVIFNYNAPDDYYFAAFSENKDPKVSGIFKYSKGRLTQLARFSSSITPRKTYNVKVEKSNGTVKVYLDGKLQGTEKDTFTYGQVGFATRNNGATFDNLTVLKQ